MLMIRRLLSTVEHLQKQTQRPCSLLEKTQNQTQKSLFFLLPCVLLYVVTLWKYAPLIENINVHMLV